MNTNMSVESFHRLLKVVYLEGKHNRRIDHLLSTLLRIARDKVYDRLIKTEKGKSTHRICEINKRHRSAIEMKQRTPVLQVEELVWKVPSASKRVFSIQSVELHNRVIASFVVASVEPVYICTTVHALIVLSTAQYASIAI